AVPGRPRGAHGRGALAMPRAILDRGRLLAVAGKSLDEATLDDLLFASKAEVEGHEDGALTISVTPDRLDLLSEGGLGLYLQGVLEISRGIPSYRAGSAEDLSSGFEVDPSGEPRHLPGGASRVPGPILARIDGCGPVRAARRIRGGRSRRVLPGTPPGSDLRTARSAGRFVPHPAGCSRSGPEPSARAQRPGRGRGSGRGPRAPHRGDRDPGAERRRSGGTPSRRVRGARLVGRPGPGDRPGKDPFGRELARPGPFAGPAVITRSFARRGGPLRGGCRAASRPITSHRSPALRGLEGGRAALAARPWYRGRRRRGCSPRGRRPPRRRAAPSEPYPRSPPTGDDLPPPLLLGPSRLGPRRPPHDPARLGIDHRARRRERPAPPPQSGLGGVRLLARPPVLLPSRRAGPQHSPRLPAAIRRGGSGGGRGTGLGDRWGDPLPCGTHDRLGCTGARGGRRPRRVSPPNARRGRNSRARGDFGHDPRKGRTDPGRRGDGGRTGGSGAGSPRRTGGSGPRGMGGGRPD